MADMTNVTNETDEGKAKLATCPECGGEGFVEARPAIVGDHEVWPTTPYHPCFVCDDGLVPAGEVGR